MDIPHLRLLGIRIVVDIETDGEARSIAGAIVAVGGQHGRYDRPLRVGLGMSLADSTIMAQNSGPDTRPDPRSQTSHR